VKSLPLEESVSYLSSSWNRRNWEDRNFTLQNRHFYRGETREDNNDKNFAINIVDDKSHVLLVEETARWEFRYLHNALERDKRIDLQQVLFEQPYMGLLPEPFFRINC